MPSRAKIGAGFAAIYLLWGATYLAIRVGDRSVPPLLLAAARFLVAGGLAYGWGRSRGQAAPTRREWRSLLGLGALMFLLGYSALFWAETRVASGVAAVLVALIPMWVAGLEAWVFRTQPASGRVVAGCLLGVGGVVLLVGGLGGGGTEGRAALALLGASFAWSFGTVFMHVWPLPKSVWINAGGQMLIGGGLLLLAGAGLGEFRGGWMGAVGWPALAVLGYLVACGSLIAYLCYVWLLEHVAAVKVASYALVNPIVALLLGFAVAGERLSGRAGVGCVVILAALALVLARPAEYNEALGSERETI